MDAAVSYGLIGFPLGHSVSPFIHRRLFASSAAFRQGDLPSYCLREVTPEHLSEEMGALTALRGFNVTIPFKQAILPYLAEITPEAAALGAVNTVTVAAGGRMSGANTDLYGFRESLRQSGVTPAGNLLLCGAGGTARMMAYALGLGGFDRLTVGVRPTSLAAAGKIRGMLPGRDVRVALLDELEGPFTMIFNATPCGMYRKGDSSYRAESPVSPGILAGCEAVFDAVYNPEETKFLSAAREAGAKCVGGVSMLVLQAAKAQEIWYGATFSEAEIARVTAETRAEVQRRANADE